MNEPRHRPPPRGVKSLVRPILHGRRRQIVSVSFSALLTGVAEAMVLVMVTRIAFALSQGNDRVSFGGGPVIIDVSIVRALLLAAAVVVLRGAFQTWTGHESATLVTDVLSQTRHDMANAYLASSWERQSQERGGRLQELLTTYVARVSSVVDAVTKGITSGLSLLALGLASVLVSPIAAVSLIVAVLVLAFTLQPLRRIVRRAARGTADTGLDFASEVSEISEIGQEIQVFGVEQAVQQRVGRLITSNGTALRRQSFFAFMFTPLYATVVLLLLIAALGAIRASGTSDLASLGAVMVMMVRSLAYAQMAQGVYGTLQASEPYLADLEEQLADYRRDAVDRSGVPIDAIQSLEFHHVGFRYGDAGFELRDATFEIAPGESIGIVGPSGSGKSTMVQLLLRLREPTAGTITADGTPIGDIALDDWRRTVAFVPQDVRLIPGTIAENISFFRTRIPPERVEAASAQSAHPRRDHGAVGRVRRGHRWCRPPPLGWTTSADLHRPRLVDRAESARARRTHERARRALGAPDPYDACRAPGESGGRDHRPPLVDARVMRPHHGGAGGSSRRVRSARPVEGVERVLP